MILPLSSSDEDQRLVIRILREHIAYRVDGAFMLPDQLVESLFSTTIRSGPDTQYGFLTGC